MTWQQSLVMGWFQFVVGSAVILGMTQCLLRWIVQPAERKRLIHCMLAAVLVLPGLIAFSPVPVWNLGWTPPDTIAQTPASLTPPAENREAVRLSPTERSADVESSEASPSERQTASETQPERSTFQVSPGERMERSAAPPRANRWKLPAFDPWMVLAVTILIAHAGAALYFVMQDVIGRLRLRHLWNASTEASEGVQLVWQSIAGRQTGRVRLRVSSQIETPLMYGWMHPVIVIPRDIVEQGGAALGFCLEHEWAHVERSDALSWHFVHACEFVMWYQLSFWALRRELRICLEILADHRCAKDAGRAIEYSELLLGLAKRRRAPSIGALTMFDRHSQLARRIKMLLEEPVPLRSHCRGSYTCGVLALSALLATAIGAVRVDSARADGDDQVEAGEPASSTAPHEAEPRDAKPTKDDRRVSSYVQIMTIEGTKAPIKTKDYIAADGRKRTESAGGTASIFDANGRLRLVLNERTNTAFVSEPRMKPSLGMENMASRYMQGLKDLRSQPDRLLGQKELEGKSVTGVVATQAGRTYTMWFDDVTGDPVLIEYDTSVKAKKAHIAMTDFRFDEAMDEALFSFSVPDGYKLYHPAEKPGLKREAKQPSEESASLLPAWSREGKWVATAGDPQAPTLYALRGGDRLDQLSIMNASGEETSTTKIDDNARFLRTANLTSEKSRDLLTFSVWGPTAKAHRTDGKLLWYVAEASVTDVCAADLNNDGLDEVLVGYIGDLGLHALDSAGQLLWKNSTLHVDNIAVANIEGDERPEIFVTSGGFLHVLDADGNYLRSTKPGLYASMVRSWEGANGNSSDPLIVVAGTDASEITSIAALDTQGKPQWTLERPGRIVTAAMAHGQPWLALTFADGVVRVLDVAAGRELAHVIGQGKRPDAAWIPTNDGPPLLVVATGDALHAYRVPDARP